MKRRIRLSGVEAREMYYVPGGDGRLLIEIEGRDGRVLASSLTRKWITLEPSVAYRVTGRDFPCGSFDHPRLHRVRIDIETGSTTGRSAAIGLLGAGGAIAGIGLLIEIVTLIRGIANTHCTGGVLSPMVCKTQWDNTAAITGAVFFGMGALSLIGGGITMGMSKTRVHITPAGIGF